MIPNIVLINPKSMKNKAFSLIEISVVVLIIAILISGISTGIDLYADYKIVSLRSFTANSVISRIPNLEFWSDTISTKSFDKSIKNNDLVNKWNNLNPNLNYSISATSLSQSKSPIFIEKGINNLPSILFDGSDDCLQIPFNLNYVDNPEVTIFLVFKSITNPAGSTINALFGNDDQGGWGRFVLSVYNSGAGGPSNGSGVSLVPNINKLNTNFILTYLSNQKASNASLTRLNKKFSNIINTHNFTSVKGPINFGLATIDGNCTTYHSNIMVSEIIAYYRALNVSEIEKIENYLAKKYFIQLVN
jgi:prepilin-type N-terminal cleavage/methylation domain-containing protein